MVTLRLDTMAALRLFCLWVGTLILVSMTALRLITSLWMVFLLLVTMAALRLFCFGVVTLATLGLITSLWLLVDIFLGRRPKI